MKNGTFGRKMLVAAALAVMLISHVALAEGQGSALLEPGSLRRAQAVAVPEAVRSNAVPGDDVEATNAALATNPPPPLVGANTKASSSRVRLLGASNSGNVKTYEYPATGDLRTWTSQSDITLYFTVTEKFTKIESATISLMAYDVDYPVATENDVTYLNGNPLGWMLQGGNESWHANNIPVRPELIELPETFGGSAVNTFFVDVDVLGEYWVTCISEATLTIKGQVGLDVDASDGTEAEGVKVTWTELSGATYTLWRGEAKGEKSKHLYNGSGTEFLDTEAEPGKIYFYTVDAVVGTRASSGTRLLAAVGEAITGDDDGYSEKPPVVTGVKFAKLFLTETGPHNIKLEWNDYKEDIYQVDQIEFTFEGVGAASGKKQSCTWKETSALSKAQLTDETDLSDEKIALKFPNGEHGEYKVKIKWEVTNKETGKNVTSYYENGGQKQLEFDASNTAKVYFNKWENDNWWNFWRRDGAIDSSATALFPDDLGSSFGGVGVVKGGSFDPDLKQRKQYVSPAGMNLPNVIEYSYNPKLELTDAAASHGREITPSKMNKPIGASYSKSKGIYRLGTVLAHELKHKENADKLYGEGRLYSLITIDGKVDLEDVNFTVLDDYVRQLGDNVVDWLKEYCEIIGKIRQDPDKYLIKDKDEDGVRDSEEKGGLILTEHDTFGVSESSAEAIPEDEYGFSSQGGKNAAVYGGYATRGDNEYLARCAETEGLKYAISDNDWAFPGCNIGNVLWCGYGKSEWAQVAAGRKAKGEIENLCKVDGGDTTGTINSARAAKSGKRLLASSIADTDNVRELGRALSSDWTSSSTDYALGAMVYGATAGTATGEGGNGFSELDFTVTVSNSAESVGNYRIAGYLVDESGKGVAVAYAGTQLVGHTIGAVSLRFAGEYIHGSRRNGYSLALVTVEDVSTDMVSCRAAKNNVAPCDRAYSYSEFAHDAVVVVGNYSDVLNGRNIDVSFDVEADSQGEYSAYGLLKGSDGKTYVATATTAFSNTGRVTLSFLGDEIYTSGCEGKFVLESLQIRSAEGGQIVQLWNACETVSYERLQFRPESVVLTVDESSFTCSVVRGQDGLVNALDVSFDVYSTSDEELSYRIDVNVHGTNDHYAASVSKIVSIPKGAMTISLNIDGAHIAARGVNGPYVVRDVRLTPQGKTGNAERFFPAMDPIDLTADDFGAFPFEVNGELTFGENANGDGYQLYVPIEIFRANTVTVTAMLVDASGKFVAMATASKKYTGSCTDSFTLAFSEEDMLASERKGPYTVRFVQIESDIPGIDPVRAKVPDTARDVSNTYIRYVDCNAVGGNGYSWSTAFSTIQNAVDAADDGDVILVADGVYAPFDTRNKLIEVKSVNGYERTFVDGGAAARCATLGFEESQTNSVLTGFTLLNGDASTSDVLVLWNCGGGVCCGTVRNCWIGGCTASKGGGAYYGDLEGCVIAGNEADTYGGGSYYGTRVNCTIVGNEASYGGSGTYYGNTFNSIVLGNTSYSAEDNYSGGVFAYSLTAPYIAGNGNVSGEVDFRDALKGDYSLTRHSVCVNAGSVDYVTQEFDIAGNRRIAGGTVDIGAFELKCSEYKAGFCDFVWDCIDASEGDVVKVSVFGGLDDSSCFVQLYLTFNSAVMADVNLAKGKVNGVMPSGGLKFPLTISWAPGETGEKVVEIPVIADTAFEGEEFFTLQLADPLGMQLGEYRDCTVTIHDKNTKATLADGIANQSLKPATSGAGKWYVVESWMAVPAETERPMFVQSPDLLSGKTSTLSFGSVKGAGDYYFDMKFLGETGTGASYVEVYDGKSKLGTLSRSDNGDGWNSWHVAVSGTVNHNISIVFTQGSDRDSHVRVANVVWIPSTASSYSVINIATSPGGAGVVGGAGTYAYGTKINFNATPRPGYTFVGWYRTNGNLFGSKAKMSVTMTGSADFIALFRKDPYVRGLADPANAGKVSGSGPCASGKKVTLKATANKGYVFEGWYDERDLRLTQAASLVVDNSAKPAKPSATAYVVTNIVSDATYYARFVTVAEDKANISCTMGGLSFPEGDAPVINVTAPCGVYVSWPILTSGLSQTSAKVAGLPTGLKFNTKTGVIEGAPSAPSKVDAKTGKVVSSVVKITVTTAGKSTKVFQVNLTVTAIPDAVVGTFNGFVSPYDDDENIFYRSQSLASFALTTTSAGKITAKAISPKGTVSFSANYWYEIDNGLYFVLLTARTGETLLLYVESEPQYWNGRNQAFGYLRGGAYGSDWLYVEAQRSSFLKSGKDYEHPEALALAKSMQGTYKFNATYRGNGEYELVQSTDRTATLSVAIKNTGAVALSGTLPGTSYRVSGSSVLRVYPSTDEADVFVCGASGKIVNVMVILSAKLGDDGKTVLTGSAYVNMVQ